MIDVISSSKWITEKLGDFKPSGFIERTISKINDKLTDDCLHNIPSKIVLTEEIYVDLGKEYPTKEQLKELTDILLKKGWESSIQLDCDDITLILSPSSRYLIKDKKVTEKGAILTWNIAKYEIEKAIAKNEASLKWVVKE